MHTGILPALILLFTITVPFHAHSQGGDLKWEDMPGITLCVIDSLITDEFDSTFWRGQLTSQRLLTSERDSNSSYDYLYSVVELHQRNRRKFDLRVSVSFISKTDDAPFPRFGYLWYTMQVRKKNGHLTIKLLKYKATEI